MISYFQVLLGLVLLTEGLGLPNGGAELAGITSNEQIICSEDGVFCYNNNEYRCIGGVMEEAKSCSNGNACIERLGCVESDILRDPSYFSFAEEYIVETDIPCEWEGSVCSDRFVLYCLGGHIFIQDCRDIGLDTCDASTKQCVTTTSSTTTSTTTISTTTPSTTTTSTTTTSTTTISTTTTSTTTTPTTTSTTPLPSNCTNGERNCRDTSMAVVCVAGTWVEFTNCSASGLTCSNGMCVHVEPPCANGNKTCIGSVLFQCIEGWWERVMDCSQLGMGCAGDTCTSSVCDFQEKTVLSSHTNIRVPDLEDGSCVQYYDCKEPVSAIAYRCDPKQCPAGQRFDACTGYCSTSALCNWPQSCGTITCTTSTPLQVLGVNNKLGYSCSVSGGTLNTIWSSCPNGYFNAVSGSCTIGTASCYNGAQNNGTCTAPGVIPLPGTNCSYRKCYGDLTHKDFTCPSGYHFDLNVGSCVLGQCS